MPVDFNEAITLACQKKKLFQEYESVTDALLITEDYDIIENYITSRTKLANNIDQLTEQLQTILHPLGSRVDYILGKLAGSYKLTAEEQEIFNITQETVAIVRRIRLKDCDLLRECERKQNENTEKIKATQNTPKISKYLRNLSMPQESLNNLGSV